MEHGVPKMGGGSRSGGERSDPERRDPPTPSSGPVSLSGTRRDEPEVPERAHRRRLSAQYKKKILEQADACKGRSGAIGALLRRGGLYSSHLTTWRRQREEGQLEALEPKKRGREAKPVNPLAGKVRELERENRRLRKQLDKAETIISFQKNSRRCWGSRRIQSETRSPADGGRRKPFLPCGGSCCL